MYLGYDIDEKLVKLADEVELELKDKFKEYDEICLYNSARVLRAFQNKRVSSSDFVEVNGYGAYDEGRNKLEAIYAELFDTEDALVRPQIMSGTHAISLAFFGLLKHGDTLISISGTPYDSLQTIVGTAGNSKNSLIANGIKYEEIELVNNDFDIPAIQNRLKNGGVKMVEIQRSRGYAHRDSLTIEKIERVCKAIREVNREVLIMVDNCYGDLVERKEPTAVGADLIVGSLMKNLGGGIAKTGGYIVGKKAVIDDIAERFSAPGLGREIGANFNENINYFKGLFMAPHAVCSSLKAMTFASRLLEKLGFDVDPKWDAKRTDIIQSVNLGTPENMVNFHIGIQHASPIDSFVTPVAAPMAGYPHDEVMASGTFTQGSTIEFSCDGPMTPPYTAYMQGSLTYDYGKLGILLGVNEILKNK
ncbi:MAG: methionine gamma-lyase family protein [Clostridia bacterium]|nr:methionine gamma-lyase family protein [Clostridia bacterium]